MPTPTFTPLQDENNNPRIIEVAAGPDLWTRAAEYVVGPTVLKVEVVDPDAVWQYAASQYCRAGGTLRNDATSILPAAPIGALIGKVGGGMADFPAPAAITGMAPGILAGVKLFAVGSFAVINLVAADSGPLFFAMNDTLAGFQQHSGKVKVIVSRGQC